MQQILQYTKFPEATLAITLPKFNIAPKKFPSQ